MTAVALRPDESTTTRAFGYLPALDGLRAVAVGAVFAFHAGVLPGGFLGVDVFFVISGFLITALAIDEVERTGRLALGAFWARRARRLLPALIALCVGVLVYSIAAGGAALERVGDDIAAALLYVSNWVQIGAGHDYFAAYEAPPLLEHTWSLAIEEQFYLVWPLVIVAAIRLGRNRSLRTTVVGVAVTIGVVSTVWAWWLAGRDTTTISRLYFGTDTRAVGLAAGAVLGATYRPGRRPGAAVWTPLGIAAAALLTVAALAVDGQEPWLYGPGFAAAAAATVAVIVAATVDGPIRRALSVAPLVALGRVSYGVYLWHWPVIVVLDADRTGLSGPALGACWVVVTAALTACSWFVVERRAPLPRLEHPARAVGYVGAMAAVGLVAVSGSARATDAARTAAYVVPPTVTPTSTTVAVAPPVTAPTSASTRASTPPATQPATTTTTASTTTTTPALAWPADRPARLLIVGDSVAASLDGDGGGSATLVGGHGVEVRTAGIIACPVIDEGEPFADVGPAVPRPAGCSGPDRFEAAASAFRPDVTLVVFGWPGFGGGTELDDGSRLRPCDPEYDRRWADDLGAILADLSNDSTHVVAATVAPHAKVESSERADCLSAAVRTLPFPVYDLAEWLCPSGDCSVSEGLRPDGAHFRDAADVQLAVVTAITSQVFGQLGYPVG